MNKPIYKLADWIDKNNIIWEYLSSNPNSINFLENNPDKIIWFMLSGNPCAISILEENQDKINWDMLSMNPNGIELLKKNQDKINWCILSHNPNAINIIKNNRNKINNSLSKSRSFEYYKSHIHLSFNPIAFKMLLERNETDENYWNFSDISLNPSIFELDYERMRINFEPMAEEIIKEVMKPSRVFKNPEYDYIEELFGED